MVCMQPLCGKISTLNSAYAPVYDAVGGEECRDRAYGVVGIVPAAHTNTFVFTLSTVLDPAHERALLSSNEFCFGCTCFSLIV